MNKNIFFNVIKYFISLKSDVQTLLFLSVFKFWTIFIILDVFPYKSKKWFSASFMLHKALASRQLAAATNVPAL